MAIVYKCKCCAANLDVEEGMRLAKCPACKTKQTLPSSRDENIQNLFNRATTLRLKSEFDKAETVYERIIQADEEQYEAYWGLILCKFGVEYVEDPKTETRIPTCHRTSFESIVADENYKLALKYVLDDEQKELYKQEAQEIDKIQKGILEVAQNEEPYDVFICYKETDENGKRTMDSVIANDIYHQLTQEGFKVFYAAITLEGKLGSAYEPIIFAALNSAKVMLAVGTKPEYFQAVWVKNEWSRFLKLNKNDRNKLLIPCYKGMDAYHLPEEFAHLQAQDMSKIGFITDLIRGVKKIIEKNQEKPTTVVVNQVNQAGNTKIKKLLKRLKLAVEDGEFNAAQKFVEQILNIDAENADTYLCALMIKLGVSKKENLKDCAVDFSGYPEYKRAYTYGDDERKKFLRETLSAVQAKVKAGAEELKAKAQLAKKKRKIALISIFSGLTVMGLTALGIIGVYNYNQQQDLKARGYCELTLSDDGKYYIVNSYAGGDENNIVIPDTYKGKPIGAIGERAFQYRSSLTEIIIPDSVTSIGEGAFFCCDSLTSITIPDGVTSIGKEAFDNCSSLTEIIIPDSVTSIGDKAFSVCPIETATIPAIAASYISNEKLKTVVITSGDAIGGSAFNYCPNLTSIVIPDSVTSIGQYAFYNCSSLTSVVIPDSVTSIGVYAFAYCGSLTSVVIGDSVTTIGNGAFFECSSLMKIVIPDSVTSIDASAFAYCNSLTIYCEATSKPSGWSSDWNSSNRPVVWGYTGE